MVAVSSSMINDVSYDADTKILSVTFSNGRTYRYAGVPPEEYDQLLGASSVGKYFIANIRDTYRSA